MMAFIRYKLVISFIFWVGRVVRRCHVFYVTHRGVQLILAYRWTRPAILEAGQGRGGFISSVSSLSFLFRLFSKSSNSSLLLSILSHFYLSLGDDTK